MKRQQLPKSRKVIWLSLVGMGYLLTLFIPVQMIFGFSLGVFFAALAYDWIGLSGLAFYFVFYCTKTLTELPLYQSLLAFGENTYSEILRYSLLNIHNNIIQWQPSIEQAITITKTLSIYHSMQPTFIIILPAYYGAILVCIPLFWFWSCRRIIKKYHITQRIGLIK
jgi:hypothetical protein